MLKNWKIKTKFLLSIAILAFISLAGLMYVTNRFDAANQAYSGFLERESNAATFGPRGAAGMWTATTWLTRALAQDPGSPAFDDLSGRFSKEFEGARNRLVQIPELVPSRKAAIDDLLAGADKLKAVGDEMLKAHVSGDPDKVRALGVRLDEAIVELSPKFGANNAAMAEILNTGAKTLSDSVSSTIVNAFCGLLAGIAAAIAIAMTIAHKGITAPMVRLRERMVHLANGETTAEIDGMDRKDEVGQMAQAVQVFRENAIERIRLAQETDANRSLSEKERIEREKARAEEAAKVTFAVESLATGLSKLSEGDVSYRISEPFIASLDAVRDNFNSSAEKLQVALERVAQNARGIEAGANEIKSAADDLAKRTEQQAASVEETAAALEEITTTVKDSSKRAQEAGELVGRAKAGAEQSGEIVRQAIVAMERIEKSSNEISNIIGVIDEIAFQTNLLALNAGVEAARAGDAGKGFAVVAQEVRELAQRSANAAKEIKSLITTSNGQVQEGVQLVGDTGKALETIVSEVQAINRHVAAIVESAQEQSSGLQQINTAVNQMDQDTQKNAAMVEESTAASHGLAREVASLNQLLAQFRLSQAGQQHFAPAPVRETVGREEPVASPARALGRKIASAFSGNAALDMRKDNWEEF
ncbi:methyl-accepting chemotaxis protein [Rhizobiaceae bacterium BDR2-2]|uniref:Methyl-accepting chemotaxis protein n=1 Tax=Ectorhizobium quercum TaxID=2965071 RepID=A0AAE3MYV0_9HYPH|nr:methyl-accepting chemotaxis protein [Ectorhizobium quercum]MCX8996996.1 methyl-accepting chemotaxis protein [Ectorhizobium quercum]